MMTKPLKPKMVDVDKVTFTPLKSLPSGAKLAYVNHDGNQFLIQTPEMNVPFDSGSFYADGDTGGKYTIKVAFDNMDTNPAMKEFHDMLKALDEKIINDGMENSLAWFKKKNPNKEVVKELYTPMVRVSIDAETGEPTGKWAPQLQFKIIKRDGKVMCDCYDSEKNKLNVDGSGDDLVDLETKFTKGTKVRMILKCNSLWVASGKFGCTWKAEQIKINSPVGFSGYAFDDSDEEDGETLTRQSTAKVETPVADNFVESEEEEDEDDEDEESEEEEEEEEVTKPKKVRRKKN